MKINARYKCPSETPSLVPVFAPDKRSAPGIVHVDDVVVVTGNTVDGYVPVRVEGEMTYDGFIEIHWFYGNALVPVTWS
jgi:hypothetical protein